MVRMTEQEDISPCYITKRGNLEPLKEWSRFSYIYLPDFDAFGLVMVWWLPSRTQANSQECFI